MFLLRTWLLRYTSIPISRTQRNDCCDGHILQIHTTRGPRGLVIALGKNLESHAAGFTHTLHGKTFLLYYVNRLQTGLVCHHPLSFSLWMWLWLFYQQQWSSPVLPTILGGKWPQPHPLKFSDIPNSLKKYFSLFFLMTASSLPVVIGGGGFGVFGVFGVFCMVGFFQIRLMPLLPILQ